jgi:hypothetical protein
MPSVVDVAILLILLKLGLSTSFFFKVIKTHIELRNNRKEIRQLEVNKIDSKKYKKSNSIPPPFLYIFGRDYFNPDVSQAALFQRDLNQRKLDHIPNLTHIENHFKYSYMNALTTDKLNIYNIHIDNFLNNLKDDIDQQKPIVSSYRDHIITLWIDLHLYNVNIQDREIIRDFFLRVVNIISIDESEIENNQNQNYGYLLKFIYTRQSYFKAYKIFKKNIGNIKSQIDKSDDRASNTISYQWMSQSEYLTTEQVITAGLHNVAAFSQFINIFYSILENATKKSEPYYLNKYNLAKSRSEKYNIIKEIFRLEVPNNFTISWDIHNQKQVTHLHQEIMQHTDATYNNFKPDMYKKHSFLEDIKLEVPSSSIDKETIVENKNPNNIPVFDKPKYCPFGFGYRRCAGENFVYFYMEKLLDFMSTYKVKEMTSGDIIDIGIQRQGEDKYNLV